MEKPEIVERFEEIERRGLLDQVAPEKRAMWEEYKKRYANVDNEKEASKAASRKHLEADIVGGITTFGDAKYFGIPKRVGGLLNAVGSYPIDRVAEAMGAENTPSFSDRYNEIVDYANEQKKEFSKDHPLGSVATQVYGIFKNPLNVKANEYIGAAKNAVSGITRAGATTAGIEAVDEISRGNFDAKDVGKKAAVAGGIAAGIGSMAQLYNLVRPEVGDAIKDNLVSVVEAAVDSKFGKFLQRSARKIEKTVEKYAKGGTGNPESIGMEAQRIANEGLKKLEALEQSKYSKVYKYVNPKGAADTTKSKQTISELLTEISGRDANLLREYQGYLDEPQNILTLGSLKRQIGKMVREDGKGSITENQMGRIYHSLQEDLYNAVKKNALLGKEEEALRSLKAADETFKLIHKKDGIYKGFKEIANKPRASEAGNLLKREITLKGANSKRLRNIERFDKAENLKDDLLRGITEQKDFNKLSPKGKDFVYGDRLAEFDNLFNNAPRDKIVRRVENAVDSDAFQKWMKYNLNGANIPYIMGIGRSLLKKD